MCIFLDRPNLLPTDSNNANTHIFDDSGACRNFCGIFPVQSAAFL